VKPFLTKLSNESKTLSWDPAKHGGHVLKDEATAEGKGRSRWPSLDQLDIPPERRERDSWGSVSIPKGEWSRCFVTEGFPDLMPRTGTKREGIVIAEGLGRTSGTAFFFDQKLHRQTLQACLREPVVALVLKDSDGRDLDSEHGVAYFETKDHAAYVYASPVCLLLSGSLLSSRSLIKESDPKRVAERGSFLLISPSVHGVPGGTNTVTLLTAFGYEYVLSMPLDKLKKVATVEVRLASPTDELLER
jgi:hypothetical protein